jgi:hypothetical protein
MSLIEARRRNASAMRLRFSQSLARRLHRPREAVFKKGPKTVNWRQASIPDVSRSGGHSADQAGGNGLDKTASVVMEDAARQWLERHHARKK